MKSSLACGVGVLGVLLVLMTLSTGVHAAKSFSAVLNDEKAAIYPDEVAYFSLTIVNNQDVPDLFTISTPEFDWFLDTSRQLDNVQPGKAGSTVIELVPKEGVPPGTRVVRVKVRSSNTDEVETFSALVTVRSLNGTNRTYAPSVFLSARTASDIDPREGATVSVYLRNRNARVYDKLHVDITSDLFSKSYDTALGPIGVEGEKTNEVFVPLDPLTPPGNHSLTVRISVDGQTVNEYKTGYTIRTFDDITRSESEDGLFFKYATTYLVRNQGNTPKETTVQHDTNFFRRLFTDASARYTVEKGKERSTLVFPLSLDPDQQAEITVTENYRLLFILAVVVLLSVIAYYLFRSPVVLRKEAVIVGGSADGVSDMKIRLFIKNRSAKVISNIHVIDRVTSMADVIKQQSLGTLQPSKIIKKKGHGTLVRWDLDVLEGFEERIITYQVKTELKLIGDVYLPAMKVKFDQRGRERTSYSNEVNIPRDG